MDRMLGWWLDRLPDGLSGCRVHRLLSGVLDWLLAGSSPRLLNTLFGGLLWLTTHRAKFGRDEEKAGSALPPEMPDLQRFPGPTRIGQGTISNSSHPRPDWYYRIVAIGDDQTLNRGTSPRMVCPPIQLLLYCYRTKEVDERSVAVVLVSD